MKSKIWKIIKTIGFSFFLLIIVALCLRAYVLMPKIWLESIAGKQTFDIAVHISAHPGKKDTYIVTAKAGKIFMFTEGSETKKELLDFEHKVHSHTTEEGMLSALIDPENHKVIYVYYCLKKEPLTTRLVRFKMDEDDIIIPESEEVLIEYTRPKTGHNSGDMFFGKDGYFWIGIGEAGFAGEKQGLKLDTHIAGSILKIDIRKPSGDKLYSIPRDNPFVGNTEGIPEEVWARGLRNQWRWSFYDDEQTTIIAGDVGNRKHEEINLIKKGDHMGWPFTEGNICSPYFPKCDVTKYKLPMTYFSRDVSRSITGGFVYRGKKVEQLKGKYIFGDYLRGIMSVPVKNPPFFVKTIVDDGFLMEFPKIPMSFGPEKGITIHPVSFYEDAERELLVVALNGGIFRIVEINFWTQLKAFLYMFGSFR